MLAFLSRFKVAVGKRSSQSESVLGAMTSMSDRDIQVLGN